MFQGRLVPKLILNEIFGGERWVQGIDCDIGKLQHIIYSFLILLHFVSVAEIMSEIRRVKQNCVAHSQ